MPEFHYFTVRAEEPRPGRKTRIYSLVNRTSGEVIGTIRWYGPWRQFCFFPEPDTVWSCDCLADLDNCLVGISNRRLKDKAEATHA